MYAQVSSHAVVNIDRLFLHSCFSIAVMHSFVMRATLRAWALVVALAFLSSGVHAIGKVTRSGRYLYNEDGSRFYIKGVAFQEQGKCKCP